MNRILSGALALSLLAGTTGIASAAEYRNNDYQNQSQYNNGHGQHHSWRRGQRIQESDWNRGQAVDYRAHRLHKPRRGYEWREVDGNYVEAALVGGLIASVIVAQNR